MRLNDAPVVVANRFQTIPYLARRFAQSKRRLAFEARSVAAWRKWRRALRVKLRELTGYGRLLRAALKPRSTESVKCGGYVRQRVEIQTEPGLFTPLFVLIPNGKGPFPAVIAAHGHGSCGKMAVANVPVNRAHRKNIQFYNYAYAEALARSGCIVFCPDARGFGERREKGPVPLLGSSCKILNLAGAPLGLTLAGMWAWDLHRLIDYIQTRKDCRRGKLACVGLSGGGLQTLYAAALDERITCAVISGYFYGVKQSLLDVVCCDCNYVPHLWEYADMGDLGCLIAPRPLCIETGAQDPLNGAGGMRNVIAQVSKVRRAYRLLRAQKNLVHDVFKGGHLWHGEKALPLLLDHFGMKR